MLSEKTLKKAISGNKKAFRKIYDELFEGVWAYVQSRIQNREVTNDIVSDSFLSLYENIENIKYPKAVKNYLYKIARSKLTSYYSKEKPLSYNDEIKVNILNTENKKEKKKIHVEKILSKLPENYREVLRLRFLSNLKIKEVAEIMDKTENNIKVMQHRAIKKANKLVKKDYNLLKLIK